MKKTIITAVLTTIATQYVMNSPTILALTVFGLFVYFWIKCGKLAQKIAIKHEKEYLNSAFDFIFGPIAILTICASTDENPIDMFRLPKISFRNPLVIKR